jgi:AraC-like DNA-binding protein
MAFDEETLRLLPRHFDFLDDPLGMGVFPAGPRLGNCFEGLIQVVGGAASASVELVLAYMNVLLTEMNEAYFREVSGGRVGASMGGDLEVFLQFKRLVEEWHAEQPTVLRLAGALGVSESRLYAVVSRLSGVSPKAFIMRRSMLEAQRLFYYDRPSVKEVAYRLGFSDPDHFSRVFKRVVGRTVTDLLADLQDLSRH